MRKSLQYPTNIAIAGSFLSDQLLLTTMRILCTFYVLNIRPIPPSRGVQIVNIENPNTAVEEHSPGEELAFHVSE